MNITRNKDSEHVQQAIERRRSRFLRALGVAGLSQNGWGREYGTSAAHLSYVLRGQRDSVVLNAKIDAFIQKHLGKPTAIAS